MPVDPLLVAPFRLANLALDAGEFFTITVPDYTVWTVVSAAGVAVLGVDEIAGNVYIQLNDNVVGVYFVQSGEPITIELFNPASPIGPCVPGDTIGFTVDAETSVFATIVCYATAAWSPLHVT